MKIGLFLGSFDPIQIAHINIASCTLNSGMCNKILFVVAKHNPGKKHAPADFNIRCEMVEAAIQPFGDKCEVCRLEENIDLPSYSYKVLTKIRELYRNDELYILSGTDTFNKMPSWKNWESDIKPYFKHICVSRGLVHPKDIGMKLEDSFVTGSFSCKIGQVDEIIPRTLDVSSTVIRNMIQNGMNPYPLVTKDVLNIIEKYNLYKQ